MHSRHPKVSPRGTVPVLLPPLSTAARSASTTPLGVNFEHLHGLLDTLHAASACHLDACSNIGDIYERAEAGDKTARGINIRAAYQTARQARLDHENALASLQAALTKQSEFMHQRCAELAQL